MTATVAKGVCFGLLAMCLSLPQAFAAGVQNQTESESPEAKHLANWVIDSGDNGKMPFVIVDKKNARVLVFNAQGQLRGSAPALLGLARGDDIVPGIGNQKLSTIRPDERITPSGRFVAGLGHILSGQEVLWVDYDAGIAIHRVVTSNVKEHRAQRLASPTVLDKRISYGCINVPVTFYENIVSPTFRKTNGVVYILPETRSGEAAFFAQYGH
ncbi:hypothetical protein LSG25_09915 [Paralcaligenes sp. KSB-10]|uniref:hypothetical protein n=1 Tax=Paralcaligenes sp. KSB-10 TaxID=2901142 RepID=UPI001E2DF668|nr:hypothetical protein [Paralcaligenes sp. KSB-10]UHL66139.1 hypothetical protein LSG25_09915 [Paralcaligenes sp. KSB-10]